MKLIKAISRRLPSFRLDVNNFGLFVAVTNMFWPVLFHMPLFVFKVIMSEKHKLITKYLTQRLLPVINRYKESESNGIYNPKAPIWVCWLQGEESLPELCKLSLNSIKRHNNGHPVILLSLENYSNYIILPEYIVQKYKSGLIGQAHFADILRTVLLAEHGGCWIDASVLLTDNLKGDIFEYPFYSCKFSPSPHYITNNIWSNFFLAAQKGAMTFRFVRDMFYEYLKHEDRFIDYFMMDYIIRLGYDLIPAIRREIDKLPFNNTKVHDLYKILDKPYSADLLDEIFEDTYIHKLNWRISPNDYREGTIFNYLYADKIIDEDE